MSTTDALGPDYDPATWALGYQTRQFGVADDPSPSDLSSPRPPGSIYSALASPSAVMTAAITKPNTTNVIPT